jgi:hypothetical protein
MNIGYVARPTRTKDFSDTSIETPAKVKASLRDSWTPGSEGRGPRIRQRKVRYLEVGTREGGWRS